MNYASFLDEFRKIAATRAVKEWQKATAGGDQATADQIAHGYGQLGLKPRQLKDVSIGGGEAGVDLMMGRKAVPSTGEVNQSGYIARKLYKPDSVISRGEFTPQLLEQKQQMTDTARSLSPEAKQMVPAMYGHETMGQGPLQRTVSYHEYVPGISDLRGQKSEVNGRDVYSNPRGEYMGAVNKVNETVINPMEARGQRMMDTTKIRSEGGAVEPNWGNVVKSPQGPKVLDFLPHNQSQPNAALASMHAYKPSGDSKFGPDVEHGQNPNVGDLRKEVFNPQMKIEKPTTTPPPTQSGVRPVAAAPQVLSSSNLQSVHTVPPMSHAAPIPLVRPHVPAAPMAAAGGMLQRAEGSVAGKVPGMLSRIGKFFR